MGLPSLRFPISLELGTLRQFGLGRWTARLVGLALLGGFLVLYQVSILNTHLMGRSGPLDVVAKALWCPTPWRPLLLTSRPQSPVRWVFNIEIWYYLALTAGIRPRADVPSIGAAAAALSRRETPAARIVTVR